MRARRANGAETAAIADPEARGGNPSERRRLMAARVAAGLVAGSARAASHREAPLMTLDPAADITDVYAFVSYDGANVARAAADRKVTLIMNVVPGQEPGSGPN